MKKIIIFLFVMLNIVGYAQAQLGITSTYTFLPGDTVGWNDTTRLYVFVKNKGTATFTGSIVVRAKVDTVAGVSCGADTLPLTTILTPGDSVGAMVKFVPLPGVGGFNKAGCCGNVIVVWPYASNAITVDSSRAILYIAAHTGIQEIREDAFNIYPNPATSTVKIKATDKVKPEKIMIYDVYARKVKDLYFSDELDVSDLDSGMYWILINVSGGKRYQHRFIKE